VSKWTRPATRMPNKKFRNTAGYRSPYEHRRVSLGGSYARDESAGRRLTFLVRGFAAPLRTRHRSPLCDPSYLKLDTCWDVGG
jgi:hypothetical protein